jgi:hypothetical protein
MPVDIAARNHSTLMQYDEQHSHYFQDRSNNSYSKKGVHFKEDYKPRPLNGVEPPSYVNTI